VTFLNTAILPILINANMEEQPISFGLNGEFSDFNASWFLLTGNTIVVTMIFNAFYPLIEFAMYYVMRLFYRVKDRCCTRSRTRSRTI
jgi:hypothetical protein